MVKGCKLGKGRIVTKQCADCGIDLSVSVYARAPLCPDCKVEHARGYCRKYYAANKNKFADKRRVRYAEHKEHDTEIHQQWISNNREQVNESTRMWRSANKEKWEEYTALYRKENRERFRGYDSRRRSAALQDMDKVDRELSLAYRKAIRQDACFYCRKDVSEHVDHFFPLSKGGNDYWFNLVTTCQNCNQRKRDKCGTWFLLRNYIPAKGVVCNV